MANKDKTNSMNISKKELNEIKKRLYKGALEDIAKKADYSPLYVGQFFSGEREITHNNCHIITIALNLIESYKNEESALKNRIAKTIGQ